MDCSRGWTASSRYTSEPSWNHPPVTERQVANVSKAVRLLNLQLLIERAHLDLLSTLARMQFAGVGASLLSGAVMIHLLVKDVRKRKRAARDATS